MLNSTSPLRAVGALCFNCHVMTNALYYGDNLAVLREHVADESVNLVYLDPPLNSNASYSIYQFVKLCQNLS